MMYKSRTLKVVAAVLISEKTAYCLDDDVTKIAWKTSFQHLLHETRLR